MNEIVTSKQNDAVPVAAETGAGALLNVIAQAAENPAAVTKPGVYDMPESQYHADPCPAPSLSHSVAKLLLDRSPLHAKFAQPRLTVQPGEKTVTPAMLRGTVFHALMLGKGAEIAVCQFPNWLSKEAKVAKADAIATGKTPILAEDYDNVRAAVTAATEQLRAHSDLEGFFAPCTSEAVIVWQDSGAWCRSMIDRRPDDVRFPLYDLKFTGVSANPEEFERRYVREYATQDAFYRRGEKALTGVTRPATRFIVVEAEPPYAVSVIASAPSLEHFAAQEIERAVDKWAQCIRSGIWPGYPAITAHVECPAWLSMRAEERALRDEFLEELEQ